MGCCSGGARYAEAERQFGPAIAARDLERYRRKGPDATSRLLLDAVRDHVNDATSLLDIGAGVGVLGFELLTNGVKSATFVDASPAYLDAAAREAESRKVADRLRRVIGDFALLADGIESADVVTMHRVVCCYPDHASLLQAAAKHARRVFAFSYPHDRWYVRFWLRLENTCRRLFGNPFRTFVHAPGAMEMRVTQDGFVRTHRAKTVVWSIDVYVRQQETQKLSHKYGSRLNIGMIAVALDGMDLTDAQWAVLEPTFRPRRRQDGRGRPWTDPRAALAR